MTIRNKILLFLCCLAVALLAGCSSGAGVIRMDLKDPINNLDPQFTTEDAAQMLLLNLGEGLMVRKESNGLDLGVTRDYIVSEDGLTYTFTLREDACWEDGEPVLASQFVFAFERMFTPGALSPNASHFEMLQGAEALLSGRGSLRDLGIASPDDATLVFTLAHPSASFLEQLATAAALPCREDFFTQSRGRYGLERGQVLANGPFTLSRWDNSSLIRLDRNDAYRSPRGLAIPERVVLYVGRGDPVAQYLSGKNDLVAVGSAQRKQVEGKGSLTLWENRVWCVVFNQNNSVWANPLLRQSLACTLDSVQYAAGLTAGLRPAQLLVPPSASLGQNYMRARGKTEQGFFIVDPPRGKRLLTLGLEAQNLQKLPSVAVLVPEEHRSVINQVTQSWQQHLNVSIFPEATLAEDLERRLKTSDFQMLLYSYTSGDSGPDQLLRRFMSGDSENVYGYNSVRFDTAMEFARAQKGAEASLKAYAAAEQLLLEDGVVLPLLWETTGYVTSPKLTGVEITSGGLLLFHSAVKAG